MIKNIFHLNIVSYLEKTSAYRSGKMRHALASEEAEHFREIAHKVIAIETQQPEKFKQV